MNESDLEYTNLLRLIQPYIRKGHTESRAFLNWFLENILRLDETTAEDIICDGTFDKGVDAIYVDTVLEEIQVFQSRVAQNPGTTLGDTQLKEFTGSLTQFQTPQSIDLLLQGRSISPELVGVVNGQRVRERLVEGYSVVGVFVTNRRKDSNAEDYLKQSPTLRVYDAADIAVEYVDVEKPSGVPGVGYIDCYGIAPLEFRAGNNTKVIIIPALASDLVQLRESTTSQYSLRMSV
jgi:hypothetical protein